MKRTKRCTRCHAELSLSAFYVSQGRVKNPCKACTRDRRMERYTESKVVEPVKEGPPVAAITAFLRLPRPPVWVSE